MQKTLTCCVHLILAYAFTYGHPLRPLTPSHAQLQEAASNCNDPTLAALPQPNEPSPYAMLTPGLRPTDALHGFVIRCMRARAGVRTGACTKTPRATHAARKQLALTPLLTYTPYASLRLPNVFAY